MPILEQITKRLDAFYGDYAYHALCLLWDSNLITGLILAHLVIALAYLWIPYTIMRPSMYCRIPHPNLFICFVGLCGLTHLIAITVLFLPAYVLQVALLIVTAIVSAMASLGLHKLANIWESADVEDDILGVK